MDPKPDYALAFSREGATVIISYLNETEDAEEIQRVIQNEGHECILIVSNFSFHDILLFCTAR
jgi:NAD(P)-dependent dehydrogenase (short-subunit alcohol dehydrogenase family)